MTNFSSSSMTAEVTWLYTILPFKKVFCVLRINFVKMVWESSFVERLNNYALKDKLKNGKVPNYE